MDTAITRPISEQFRNALDALFVAAEQVGHQWIDVNCGRLHQDVGGYLGTRHKIRECCDTMNAARRPGDRIIDGPRSARGVSLMIRYRLPR